ncbi:MAG: cell envelope integrity EipB family protein [Pseudomonadota bacterium]
MTRHVFTPLATLAIATLLSISGAYAAGLDGLRAHRAVYDLALDKASERSGITGMNGRIVYEMKGSVCEGFAVRFRFLTTVQTPRKSFTTDQRSTTFESGDGLDFSFVTQSFLNGQLERELRGSAERKAQSVDVTISKPNELSIRLDGAIFMTAHIGKLIEAAKNEDTIFAQRVFDGSDNGDKLVDTTAIIGKSKPNYAQQDGETPEIAQTFEDEPGWPMSVSYFDTDDNTQTGEKTPIYQVSFILHESGVSRRLKMQYEDYSLNGALTGFEYLESKPCD